MFDIWNPIVDKVVTKLELSEDSDEYGHSGKQYLRFTIKDGTQHIFVTDGGCCSRTWINDLLGVTALLGATIYKIEEVKIPDPGNVDDYDVLQDYGVKFETTKGYFDIVYRNESNGYYGGSLEMIDDDTDLSKETWHDVIADYSA